MNRLDSDNQWTVGWGITSLCDLSCPFCYSAPVRPLTGRATGTSLTQAVKFLKRNGRNIRAINFGTGESFISPLFPDLIEQCVVHAPTAKIAVTTNGALADLPDTTWRRVGRCLTECDISLDFSDANAHDRWRGRQGTWRRAIRAARQAKDFGCKTTLVMVGTAQTLTEDNLKGMMAIAGDMGVVLRVNMYMPTSGDFSFAAPVHVVWSTISLLSRLSVDILSSDRLFSSFLARSVPENRSQSCRILPSGDITPSTYLLGDPWIVSGRFDQIALSILPETDPFRMYADPVAPVVCERCERVATCRGGSVERRWLWTGSLEAPDPFCPIHLADQPPGMLRDLPLGDRQVWNGPTIHLDYLPTIVAIPL